MVTPLPAGEKYRVKLPELWDPLDVDGLELGLGARVDATEAINIKDGTVLVHYIGEPIEPRTLELERASRVQRREAKAQAKALEE
eukprot:SAG11_NODE_254_length_11587_cov_4.312913_6_plen_85_part_00